MGKIIETAIEGSHGQLTRRMAREITPYWEARGYYILHDHDPSREDARKIVSWFGEQPYKRATQLSHIDIAIIEKKSESVERVLALIEIEETTDKPKTILGDVFGILMGEHISFGKAHPLVVDEHTALFVFGKSKVSHKERIDHMLDKINSFKSNLQTGNSKIQIGSIKTFSTDEELKELLTNKIPSPTP